MPEFDLLTWTRQPADGDFAKELRHDVRMHRREKGRSGHRFNYNRLKSLWSVGGIHAVMNHQDDPTWQFWHKDALSGWNLMSWHLTRREAQAAAEQPLPDLTPKPKDKTYGLHVYAGWSGMDPFGFQRDWPSIVVPCSSEYTAGVIVKIFEDMGCEVKKDLVQ